MLIKYDLVIMLIYERSKFLTAYSRKHIWMVTFTIANTEADAMFHTDCNLIKSILQIYLYNEQKEQEKLSKNCNG